MPIKIYKEKMEYLNKVLAELRKNPIRRTIAQRRMCQLRGWRTAREKPRSGIRN